MQTYYHPRSGRTAVGVRLLPGTAIKQGDLYDADSGGWNTSDSSIGLIVSPQCLKIWLRQPESLSERAKGLLLELNQHINGYDSIVQRDGGFYIVSKPEFNRGEHVNFGVSRVLYPECIEELVDHGLLMCNVRIVGDWHPGFSECEPGGINCVWTLTVAGQQDQQSDAA